MSAPVVNRRHNGLTGRRGPHPYNVAADRWEPRLREVQGLERARVETEMLNTLSAEYGWKFAETVWWAIRERWRVHREGDP